MFIKNLVQLAGLYFLCDRDYITACDLVAEMIVCSVRLLATKKFNAVDVDTRKETSH
jgi:hypothetical protein